PGTRPPRGRRSPRCARADTGTAPPPSGAFPVAPRRRRTGPGRAGAARPRPGERWRRASRCPAARAPPACGSPGRRLRAFPEVPLHRGHDVLVAGAPAERPGQLGPKLLALQALTPPFDGQRRQQEGRRAVAALEPVLLPEGFLQRV